MKALDLAGLRSGRITVLHRAHSSKQGVFWACRCDCGNETVLLGYAVRTGHSRSCGCLKTEHTRRMGVANKRHGMTRSTEFKIWTGMRERCTNPNATSHAVYGGRGIAVCDRWANSFEAFYADMGARPRGTSIDRIDNDKGYSPENCRWATVTEQARNTSANRLLRLGDEVRSVSDWAEKLSINYNTLLARLRRGWSDERSLTYDEVSA